MGYRDEAEALRARVTALEQAHADVVAQRDALKAELEASEDLAGDEPSTERAPEEEPPPDAVAPISPSPSSRLADAWDVVWTVAVEAWPVTMILSLTAIGSLLMAMAEAGVRHPYELTWGARVIAVEGAPLHVGQACTVTVRLRTNRKASYDIDDLVVRCGDHELYGWTDPIERRRSNDDDDDGPDTRCSSLELLTEARATLSCRDVGGRLGGRPEMKLDTRERGLSIWRDQPPFLRARLEVDERSAPVSGPPPFSESPPHRVSPSTLFE